MSVPRSSSGPQRPQFLTASKISSNSRRLTGAGFVTVVIACSPPSSRWDLSGCAGAAGDGQPGHPGLELADRGRAVERADLERVPALFAWLQPLQLAPFPGVLAARVPVGARLHGERVRALA